MRKKKGNEGHTMAYTYSIVHAKKIKMHSLQKVKFIYQITILMNTNFLFHFLYNIMRE